jgi:formylglycine-generating enzyme required for sulfatase activity
LDLVASESLPRLSDLRHGLLHLLSAMGFPHLACRAAVGVAVLSLLGMPLCAQARTTVLVGPPALGATCFVEHRMPVSATPLVGGFLWSAPFAGAAPVAGLPANGLLRVDPSGLAVLGVGVSTGAPPLTMALAVPSLPALLGVQLECQSFDLDATGTFQLASNDVLLTVGSGPSPLLNMVPIAPGTFQMGSMAGPANEQPVRQVTLTRPFWMGKYEVTQAEYASVVGSNPSFFQGASHPNAAQRPVEQVSWNSAVAYCAALTAIEQAAGRVPQGYQYRLPTEAEWEYCCRAGTTTEWHTGASLSTSQANFQGVPAQTTVVGSYAPNAFGLHDMHGNVAEWCLDSFASYTPGPATDPFVTGGLGGLLRMMRGGGWNATSTAGVCRSAYRLGLTNFNASPVCGFRVVLAPIVAP